MGAVGFRVSDSGILIEMRILGHWGGTRGPGPWGGVLRFGAGVFCWSWRGFHFGGGLGAGLSFHGV